MSLHLLYLLVCSLLFFINYEKIQFSVQFYQMFALIKCHSAKYSSLTSVATEVKLQSLYVNDTGCAEIVRRIIKQSNNLRRKRFAFVLLCDEARLFSQIIFN